MPNLDSDDEIITSHMFDRIMERFDKLESRMEANDRRLGKLRPPSHPKPLYGPPDYGVVDFDNQQRDTHSTWSPKPYANTAVTNLPRNHNSGCNVRISEQSGFHARANRRTSANFASNWGPPLHGTIQPHSQFRQASCWDPSGFRSPQELDHEDQPRTRNNSCWGPPPGRSHQGYSYQHPTRLRSCHEQPLDWPPPALRSSSSWYLQGLHLTQSLQPATRPNSCWVPPRVQLEQPTHQPLRPPTCWDYRVQQESQAYDQQHPTTGPLEYQAYDFAAIDGGDSESVYYTNDYRDSVDYEGGVDASFMRQPVEDKTWFPANEIPYPSDNVKGKGQVSKPATTSRFHPWQLGNCPTPRAADSRCLSRPHLLHDPSSSSLPGALAVPPPPLQRSPSYCPTNSAAPLPAAAAAAVPSVNWSPPAVFSPSCNPNISGKEESLLDDGVARERKIVEEEKLTLIMKETNLHNGDENGLMDEVMNCLHEVSYPSVLVSLILLCAFDPGICVSFSTRNCEFLAMQMAKMDLLDENEKLHIDNVVWKAMDMLSDDEGFIKCLFATETFSIGLNMPAKPVVFTNVQKFDGDDDRRRSTVWCVFDPGGDSSPTLPIVRLFMVSWFPP